MNPPLWSSSSSPSPPSSSSSFSFSFSSSSSSSSSSSTTNSFVFPSFHLLIHLSTPHPPSHQLTRWAARHGRSFLHLNPLAATKLLNYRHNQHHHHHHHRHRSNAAAAAPPTHNKFHLKHPCWFAHRLSLLALHSAIRGGVQYGLVDRFISGEAKCLVAARTSGMKRSKEMISYGMKGRSWSGQQRCKASVWCEYGDQSSQHSLSPACERGPSPTSDHFRHWLYASQEPPPSSDRFVVVSYNILSDDNAQAHFRQLYYHIPARFMSWDWRKWRLVQELGLWSPDLICLQEVDRYNDLHEELSRKGYAGVYKARTGNSTDGCAIFWRKFRFQLIQEEGIEFRDFGLRDNVAQLCVFQTIPKDNYRHLAYATHSRSNRGSTHSRASHIVVANIHVLFNPKRGDIKLGQVRILLERAHSLSIQWGGAPVIVAGDFNCTPKSALYDFLSNSELDISRLDRRTISGQVEENEDYNPTYGHDLNALRPPPALVPEGKETAENCLDTSHANVPNLQSNEFCDPVSLTKEEGSISVAQEPKESRPDMSIRNNNPQTTSLYQWTLAELQTATGNPYCTTVSHNLTLRSAYSEIKGHPDTRDSKGEPLVTTYHRKFMGTVDYIWHSEGLDTSRILDVLPVHVLQRSRGLPNHKWGSDHLALACELAFLP